MSKTQQMSKEAEKQLLHCVEQVIEKVNDGTDPTDALVTISKEADLNEQLMRRVGEAYNNSRTIHEFNEKSGEDRAQAFPIINVNRAVESLFPAKPVMAGSIKSASVVRSYYNSDTPNLLEKAATIRRLGPGTFEKAASASCCADPSMTMAINKKKKKQDVLSAKTAEFNFTQAVENFRKTASEFSESIRTVLCQYPFHKLEAALVEAHGEKVAQFVDLAWDLSRAEKLGHRRAMPAELDFTNQTYSDFYGPASASIENLITSAATLHKLSANRVKSKPKLQEKQGFFPEAATTKSAFMDATTGILGELGGSVLNSDKLQAYTASEKKKNMDKAIGALLDPVQRDRMKAIQAQVMLHDFLANDEIISHHPADQVIDMFNQLYDVAPDAALKPIIMRDMLRRGLDKGGLEALEVGQLGELNKNISEQQISTPIKDIEENMLADPKNLQRTVVAQEAQAKVSKPTTGPDAAFKNVISAPFGGGDKPGLQAPNAGGSHFGTPPSTPSLFTTP